jgi:putative selenium metabolism hydrolase
MTRDDMMRLVDEALDPAAIVAACREVVATPSESGSEAAVAVVFERLFRDLGFDTVERDAHNNVVATIRGSGNGPSVMLNGHIDHVPVGEMVEPFSAKLVDASRWGETGQAIYGRGTCDMKCNVVVGAHAVAALKRTGADIRGDIVLVADVKEEIDSLDGVASVIDRGLRADFGISLESTGLGVFVGHRGKIEFDALVKGRTAHSSEPRNGANAAVGAARLVSAVEAYGAAMQDDDLLGAASVAVTHIRSWPFNGTPLIPDRATIRIDRRYVRSEAPATVAEEVAGVCRAVEKEMSGIAIELRQVNHYPLMFTDPDSPVVRAARDACATLSGNLPPIGAWRFGVNGTFMTARGIPTVGIGPGLEKWAHTPDEHVLVDDLTNAAKIVARTLLLINSLKDEA